MPSPTLESTEEGGSVAAPSESRGSMRLGVIVLIVALLLTAAKLSSGRKEDPPDSLPKYANSLIGMGQFRAAGAVSQDTANHVREEFTRRFQELLPAAPVLGVAQRFATNSGEPARLSRELGLKTLLTGEVVQTSSNVLILRCRLQQPRTGATLWEAGTPLRQTVPLAETWTNLLADVMPAAIKTLSSRQQKKISPGMLARLEALNSKALALSLAQQDDDTRLAEAIEHLNRSAELFPSCKEIHLALASLHRRSADRYLLPRQAMAQALNALEAAQAIAPNDTAARALLAAIRLEYNWNWVEAENDFQSILAADPADLESRALYTRLLQCRGRTPEARHQLEQLRAVDPNSFRTTSLLARQAPLEGKQSESIALWRNFLQNEPQSKEGKIEYAAALAQKGQFGEALAVIDSSSSVSTPEIQAWRGFFLAKLGRIQEAQEYLRELKERSRTEYMSPRLPAIVCVGLERYREALVLLGNAYTYRSAFMTGLKVDYPWSELSDERKFQEYVRRVGL